MTCLDESNERTQSEAQKHLPRAYVITEQYLSQHDKCDLGDSYPVSICACPHRDVRPHMTEIMSVSEHTAILTRQDAAVAKLVESAENIDCGCPVSARLSGHLSHCQMPQLYEALAAYKKARGE